MMWKGQYRAIMFIIFVVGVVLGFTVSEDLGIWIVLIQLVAALVLALVDFLMKAIKGKPLFYDTKIM
ncbi:MAG: hypothetical protein PHO65_07035 [Sulfurovum sp.]|nr:hypothetical protein [Sulfurovum sp.]